MPFGIAGPVDARVRLVAPGWLTAVKVSETGRVNVLLSGAIPNPLAVEVLYVLNGVLTRVTGWDLL